jgi:hypothetical protein
MSPAHLLHPLKLTKTLSFNNGLAVVTFVITVAVFIRVQAYKLEGHCARSRSDLTSKYKFILKLEKNLLPDVTASFIGRVTRLGEISPIE